MDFPGEVIGGHIGTVHEAYTGVGYVNPPRVNLISRLAVEEARNIPPVSLPLAPSSSFFMFISCCHHMMQLELSMCLSNPLESSNRDQPLIVFGNGVSILADIGHHGLQTRRCKHVQGLWVYPRHNCSLLQAHACHPLRRLHVEAFEDFQRKMRQHERHATVQ